MSFGIVEVDNIERIIEDTDGNKVKVSNAGELLVKNAIQTPVSSTSIKRTIYQDVNGSSSVTDDWIIPNGVTLYLQTFKGGSEDIDKSSKAILELIDGGNTETLGVAYCGGNNFFYQLADEIIGDGTKLIRITATRLDAVKREMYVNWSGYYE